MYGWQGFAHRSLSVLRCRGERPVFRHSARVRSIWMQPSEDPPTVLLALSVATGLPIALWTWKCLMLVLFQRKIIYMGYIPPGARTEGLDSITVRKGITCEEVNVPTNKGNLSGIVVSPETVSKDSKTPHTIVLYLQGNAGNPLHRLPVFETLLSRSPSTQIIAIAPRSYWKSSPRRPNETGIISDYQHALRYTISRWPDSPIVLYGHSLGGSVAVQLSSTLDSIDFPTVKGLILENPFASIPKMVTALYPQRWLPYHYLTPFVWDRWDAVYTMKNMPSGSLLQRLSRDMLLLLSEKDEVVPISMGTELFNLVRGAGLRRRVIVEDALHENAWQQRQWTMEMSKYIAEARQKPSP